MTEADSNVSATALKAFAVLDFIGEQRQPVSVLEVAEAMRADRATAYRMLMTLVRAGYVARSGEKAYRLSYKPLTLARYLVSEDQRAKHIIDTLRAISNDTGEAVNYSVLEGNAVVLIFRVRGEQRVAVDFQVGDRSPPHCTAVGKVLLSYRDVRVVESLIAKGLPRFAPNTITDGGLLLRALADIRAQGFAYDDLELAPDMRCVAAPVFEKNGEVPGGISITGPSSRFSPSHLEHLRDIVLGHAQSLSRSLGGLH